MDPTQVTRDDNGVMRCRECGFAYNLTADEIAARAAQGLDAVQDAIAGVAESSRYRRPSSEVWSVNAYAAHLADAAAVITGRVRAIATQERPPLPYHDQDRAVEESRADEISAADSLVRLKERVMSFRAIAQSLTLEQWDRVGIHERAGEVSLREIAHDMPHELEHHAMDIRHVGGKV